MTDKNDAICPHCQGTFAAERAELGYNYCMKKECCEKGFKAEPIEITFTEADTARF